MDRITRTFQDVLVYLYRRSFVDVSNALIRHPSCWQVLIVRSVVCLGESDKNLPIVWYNPDVKWSSSFQNCAESMSNTANTFRTPVVRSHVRVGGSRKRRSNLKAFCAETLYSCGWSYAINAKHSDVSSSSRYSGRSFVDGLKRFWNALRFRLLAYVMSTILDFRSMMLLENVLKKKELFFYLLFFIIFF